MVLGTVTQAPKIAKGIASLVKTSRPLGNVTLKSLLSQQDPNTIKPLTSPEISKILLKQTGHEFSPDHIAKYRRELDILSPKQEIKKLKEPLYNFFETIPGIEKVSSAEIAKMPGFKIFRDKGIQEGFFKDHLNQFLSSKGLKADISAIQKKQYATGQKLQGNIDKNQDAATALEKYLTENDHRYISNEELVNVFPKYKNIFTTSGGKGIIDHGPLKNWRKKNDLSSELGRRTTQTKGEYNPLLTKGKKPINPELQKKLDFRAGPDSTPIKHLEGLTVKTSKIIDEAADIKLDGKRTKLVQAHGLGFGRLINPVDHKIIRSKMSMIPDEFLDELQQPKYFLTLNLNNKQRAVENRLISSLLKKYNLLGYDFDVNKKIQTGNGWSGEKIPLGDNSKVVLKSLDTEIKKYIDELTKLDAQTVFYNPMQDKLVTYGKSIDQIPGLPNLISQIRRGTKRKEGGLINDNLTDTIPPNRGPMPDGIPLLDPEESIQRQKFGVGGFARLFGTLSKVPKAVARVGDIIKPVGKAEKATDVAVAQAVEDKPAMFLSTVNAIEDMPEVNMGAQQWLGTIKNKPGVSATELDEFGLEQLLTNIAKADPKRKLSKTELLEIYNKEMPKIDMDIAMAEPVSRGAKDITKMLTAVREKGHDVRGYENLKVLSDDPRLLTALHQPPQDATGMKIRANIINTMRGTNKIIGEGDDANIIPLLKEQYGGQQIELHTGQHFSELWQSSFPKMYHGTNEIVKRDHFNVLKNLVPAEDVTSLSVAKNIPEEEAFKHLYQALNIFDRQVMTADVPIPFWTKKMLYRLGDMSEGRGFFYKSKKSPSHEGAQFIPGGSGYGELKFYQNFDTGAVRAAEKEYRAGHFSGEVFKGNAGNSPFGWGRFSERIDESGRKILLMEEIQSDLHQQVAQKGYKYAPRLDKGDVLAEMGDFAAQLDKKMQTLESTRLRKDNIMGLSRVERESPENVAELKNIEKAMKKLVADVKKLKAKVEEQKRITGRTGQVHPDTAFKKSENYAKVFLQGLMKMAADKGYDGIALSTGKMKKAHGNIPKGGDKWYDEIGVKAMKRIAKKSGFKFKDTTIVDGNGFTWEKIPLIEIRDINTGMRYPGQSTIPVYSKGGFVKQNMVRGNNNGY
jgi:hypothetical protein